MTILRASPASWTCERWGGEREREREKRSEVRERERAKREQEKQTLLSSKLQTHLGGLRDLDDLEGLACGLSVDLLVRWERRKEKEVRKNLCDEQHKILGRRKHVFSLTRALLSFPIFSPWRASP